jgi:hypothetical protein
LGWTGWPTVARARQPRGDRAEAVLKTPAHPPEVLDDGLVTVRPRGGGHAASASVSPPKVLDTNTSSNSRISSRGPTTAASGRPLAMPLPNVARSGTTPK